MKAMMHAVTEGVSRVAGEWRDAGQSARAAGDRSAAGAGHVQRSRWQRPRRTAAGCAGGVQPSAGRHQREAAAGGRLGNTATGVCACDWGTARSAEGKFVFSLCARVVCSCVRVWSAC